MIRVLLVDNHDSFTYNLVQMIRESPRTSCTVIPHNRIQLEEVADFDKIIFSPGPGLPAEFPAMFEILSTYAHSRSILGVCLGHQAIAEHFGGSLVNLPNPLHGIRQPLAIQRRIGLVSDIPEGSFVGQYHSWAVGSMPQEFEITSTTADGLVMSMQHRALDIQGVQFHPESYMTSHGQQMMERWLHA